MYIYTLLFIWVLLLISKYILDTFNQTKSSAVQLTALSDNWPWYVVNYLAWMAEIILLTWTPFQPESPMLGGWCILGLYWLSGKISYRKGKTSYRQIMWSLLAARLYVIKIIPICNLTGISAALLPSCPSNFRAIGKDLTRNSWLRDFMSSYGKTSYCLVNRGPAEYFAGY